MRKEEVTLFDFDELSDEAKERAHRDWLAKGHEHAWWKEAKDTIEAIEKEFRATIGRWSYNSYRYDYSLSFSDSMSDALALRGNRARAWLWNNYGHLLLTPRMSFWTPHDGKLIRAVSLSSRKYVSKCFFDRVYDGTCPLTGVCFDCNALDPLAYFCFGVRWDEAKKARVPSSRNLAYDNSQTVEDILTECVESLFQALKEDCEWQESMEYFKDLCDANEWEFTENGDRWR